MISYGGFRVEYTTVVSAPTNTSTHGEMSDQCGGTFTAASGNFSSPLYPSPYPDNASCNYTIVQPNGTYVKLTLMSIDIAPHNTTVYGPWHWNDDFDNIDGVHCSLFEFLEIREFRDNNSYARMERLCGNENDISLPATFTSTENYVEVRFTSDNIGNNGQGFMIKFERQDCNGTNNVTCGSGCGGNFTAESGVLTSPYYPGNYTAHTTCTYFISRPPNTSISYTFTFMDLEGSMLTGCYDRVDVFDGDFTQSDYIGHVCGTQPLGPLVSTQSSIWLRYNVPYMSMS